MIRLNDEEFQRITRRSKALGMAPSVYFRLTGLSEADTQVFFRRTDGAPVKKVR
jgi:hypothetical protein